MAKDARGEVADSDIGQPPTHYADVLVGLTELISSSRRRAASAANRELVLLYWQIGTVILRQQEEASWGDSVVGQLADDLRLSFPDVRGLSRANVFRMRQFACSCIELDTWLEELDVPQDINNKEVASSDQKVVTLSRLFVDALQTNNRPVEPQPKVSHELLDIPANRPVKVSAHLLDCVTRVSWSHHTTITARCKTPAERYFYTKMSAKERWSVRELRRQIDSVLFARYTGVKANPKQCLPGNPDAGDLLPFRDHYVLEFLGLEEQHSEKELRHAILSNLRDFFLEFGRDLAFVGEEHPMTVGTDTFSIDLLFFHRRLQCLIAVDLKKGEFKPEYVGKSCFYCAAADEQLRLEHEKPTLGLVLCKSADSVQVRLALTEAASRVGVATYQTGLPDEKLIRQRLAQLRFDDLPSDPTEEKSS